MPVPYLELASLGTQLLGGFAQAKESRRRFRSTRRAAQILQQRQDREQARAVGALTGARDEYLADPARMTLRQSLEARMRNPNVIDDAELSVMKAQGMDRAGANAAGAVTRLREEAQRSGLRGSPMAAGGEATLRATSFGRNQRVANELDVSAKRANRAASDEATSRYQDFTLADLDRRSSFATQLAQLIGGRQYGESALLAAMD